LDGHSWTVSGVKWSYDGKFLASCGWDRVMRLWDVALRTCVQEFYDPLAPLLSVAWSLDGSLLACGTYLQGMRVWDVATRSIRWVGLPYQVAFYRVAWSPDGTRLVGSGGDGSVYLWEATSGTLLQKFSGHQGRVTSIVWSPDGRFLASGDGSAGCGEMFVWDVQCVGDASGQEQALSAARDSHYNPCLLRTFAEHPGVVSALAWTPSGDQLISGSCDGMLRWWDVQSGECTSVRAAHQGTIQALKVSPDERWLASCADDGAIMIWDLSSHEHLRTLRCDRPYERLNITGITGLTEAQKATLQALGAIEEAAL